MKKYFILFWSIVIILSALSVRAEPDYPLVYEHYMEMGRHFLQQGDYREAINNFRRAQLAGPHELEPAMYINLIKRLLDDRIEPKPATETVRPFIRRRRAEDRDEITLRRDFRDSPKYRRRTISKEERAPIRREITPVIAKAIVPERIPREKTREDLMDEALSRMSKEVPPQVNITATKKPFPKVIRPPVKKPITERPDIVISRSEIWAESPKYVTEPVEKPGPVYKPSSEHPDIPYHDIELPPAQIIVDTPPDVTAPKTVIRTKTPQYILTPAAHPVDETQSIVYLNNELWQDQPGTLIRVELKKSIIIDAQNYRRHLIITPGFIEVELISRDQIVVHAKKRGFTFLHIWDGTGRWTFKLEVILPIRPDALKIIEKQSESYSEPFKFTYAADWSSFYTGQSLDEVERDNVNFLQRMLLEGETPYGDFDSHVIINKFQQSTEVTGYGVGLTHGKIGNFKDFSIRGFDIQKVFSPLSLPGQYVRGVLFEAEAFDNNFKYTFLHGRDRQVFGFLSPDVLNERESFVEGARLTLFPHEENQYSLNFAHGYGDAREPFLNDTVYSIEGQHRIKDVLVKGEYAYDETSTALTASTKYEGKNHDLTINTRDMESAFTTATSLPGNRGEVGGTIFWDWRLGDIDINTYLDLYRERFLPNPEAEDTVNVDFNTSIEIPISNTDSLRTSVYYVDTSGELSARNNVRSNIVYTKYFQFGDRRATAFGGLSQQRSRFSESTASEYDRYSLSTGFTLPLIKYLNYHANYEYSWLYEEQSGDLLTPNVFNTGLNYSKKIFDDWSLRSSFYYRNEENTIGNNSFLAGEDSITGGLGATYRPNEDLEFYIDGRTRNVWAEEENRTAFNEIDVRAGMRSTWGLPFRWNPKGRIAGYVFKDMNGNQVKEEDENGIADVSVEVGKNEVTTDDHGFYKTSIKAKSAEVRVNINSIPDGFVFSTPAIVDVDIIPHKTQSVHFGLTSRSGIYGIVFYDRNNNGKPDEGDEFVGKTKIILDGDKQVISDFEGTYYFEGLKEGPHEIAIDVNSLAIDYLPKLKLKTVVDVVEGSTHIFHIPLDKVKKKK